MTRNSKSYRVQKQSSWVYQKKRRVQAEVFKWFKAFIIVILNYSLFYFS